MRYGPPAQRRTASGDALMGLGMAVMAMPAVAAHQQPWGPPVFAAVFGAVGLRALFLARGGPGRHHHLHHAVGAFAMVYMALAMAGSGAMADGAMSDGAADGHSGHAGTHVPAGTPLLTGLLLVYFAVYVVQVVAHLVPATALATGETPARERRCGPQLTSACRASMGIGMLAMLLML
jgi:hypothetical protein